MLLKSSYETVSVIGLGYIGLPTAAAFAQRKVKVIGVDVNEHTVATINRGEIHIIEPDLDDAVYKAVNEGYLRATTVAEPADAFLIAVPTPFKGDNHDPDLSYIEAASRAVASVLKTGDLVVLESTSPVGATEKMAQWLAELRPDLSFPHQKSEQSDIRVAHCPERVLPGQVMREIITNDRIIGGMTPRCSREATDLYRTFVQGNCLASDVRTAEMCKLAENAFRDVNIAYANELSKICDTLGIDVWELIRLANRHPRVNILQPGTGVGGHCIAVDPWFIVAGAPKEAQIIRTARSVNDSKPDWVLAKIDDAVEEFTASMGRPPLIAALGLAFKANIDDLRESPALHVAEQLFARYGSRMLVVEPHIDTPPPSMPSCTLADIDRAATQADIIIVLVRHRLFEEYFAQTPLPSGKVAIDCVGIGL